MTTTVFKTTLPAVDWESVAHSCRGALRILKADFEIALEQLDSIEDFRDELVTSIQFIEELGVT